MLRFSNCWLTVSCHNNCILLSNHDRSLHPGLTFACPTCAIAQHADFGDLASHLRVDLGMSLVIFTFPVSGICWMTMPVLVLRYFTAANMCSHVSNAVELVCFKCIISKWLLAWQCHGPSGISNGVITAFYLSAPLAHDPSCFQIFAHINRYL